MKIGVLALQGAFAEHVAALHAIGVEAVEVRLPEQLDDVDGLIIPGGEIDDHAPPHRPLGPPRADPRPRRRGQAAVRHLRRDDRAQQADRGRRGRGPAAARRHRGAQRVRPPARFVRDRAQRPAAGRHAGPRGVHPRARDRVGRAGRGCHGDASTTAGSSPSASATSSRPRSTRSSPARPASTASWRRWPRSTRIPAKGPAGDPIPPDARSRGGSAWREAPARCARPG